MTTNYNRATEAIINSFEQFMAAFDDLNQQLEGDQAESLRKMMIAYTDLYRELMAKNDLIGRMMREKQQELNDINHEIHVQRMKALGEEAKKLREGIQQKHED